MSRVRLILSATSIFTAAGGLVLPIHPARALEGGTGAYFLGSRDSFAGIVPPPGTTAVVNDVIHLTGKGPTLSVGGVAVADPKVSVWLYKLTGAHFFETPVLGGTFGVSVAIPYGGGSVSVDGVVGRFSKTITDTNSGFADPAITPVIGWHNGNFHYSAAVSFFLPLGKYNLATVTTSPIGADNLLNFGKNRYGFAPNFSATYFDPKTGFEFSGAFTAEFSTRNTATDWQTAPALIFEGAALQHWQSGFALGAAGYAFQQVTEDSGSGAINFKTTVDAQSLKARVFGIGPIATYTTKIGNLAINLKLKYSHEFEARRRFESDVVFGTVGFAF
jgi:hypothetical protein